MSDLLVTLKLGIGALMPVLTAAVCGRWMSKMQAWGEGPMEWVLAWLGLLCCAWCVFEQTFSSFAMGRRVQAEEETRKGGRDGE